MDNDELLAFVALDVHKALDPTDENYDEDDLDDEDEDEDEGDEIVG